MVRMYAKYIKNSELVDPGGSSRKGKALIEDSNMICAVPPKSSRSISFRRSSSRSSASVFDRLAVSADSNLWLTKARSKKYGVPLTAETGIQKCHGILYKPYHLPRNQEAWSALILQPSSTCVERRTCRMLFAPLEGLFVLNYDGRALNEAV